MVEAASGCRGARGVRMTRGVGGVGIGKGTGKGKGKCWAGGRVVTGESYLARSLKAWGCVSERCRVGGVGVQI